MFRFKQFEIHDELSAMKIGTDGVLLGAWADVEGDVRILDVGTGTGLVALMLAQRNHDAQIVGIDISGDAAMEARDNFAQSPWAECLEAYEGEQTVNKCGIFCKKTRVARYEPLAP